MHVKAMGSSLICLALIAGCSEKKTSEAPSAKDENASIQTQSKGVPSLAQSNAQFCSDTLDVAQAQLNNFRKHYLNPSEIPRSYNETVRYAKPNDWTSGFVAGSFWYVFEHSQDESWKQSAHQWTKALEQEQFNTGTHDIGFMMYNSYGNGLRLTGNEAYTPIIVQSAKSLMTRYDPVVGATRSWDFGDWEFPVIIDNMMNLELLFEASKLSGEDSFATAAISHATVTMNNHFRPDYSSYHLVDYSTSTGEAIHKQTYQGIKDDSDWARGQGWGAYGYTMMYRYTKDPAFLEMAKNISDFYLSHPNMPSDLVPYFDFDAIDDDSVTNYRDSSSAALVASALFELSDYVEQEDADRYKKAAMQMLRSLASPEYLAGEGENAHFLLKQATGNYPGGYELGGSLNYADYYFLEALLRCEKRM
jgi:uncharacterized protein YyaL (SSP411 family)